jgi:hypothetical protein
MCRPNCATKALVIAMALVLGACATDGRSRIGTAAVTPLGDLNVIRADIPAILEQARKEPYVLPGDQGCDALLAQINELDEALGPDLDALPSASSSSLVERGTGMIQDTAFGALQRTAEGIIPFRSWIRKLSGAEEHAKRVSAAASAGIVRRAFLKGIGASRGCAWNTSMPGTAASTQAQ